MQTVQALPTNPAPISHSAVRGRLQSIDRLRGLVMMLMAPDHVRDYFTGVKFDPLDLTRTNGSGVRAGNDLRHSRCATAPAPWSPQSSTVFTILSFINTTKYPPSLAYLLMTIGAALLALAAFERLRGRVAEVLETYGRVPLLFYVAHIMLAHLIAGLIGAAMGLGNVILTNVFLFYPPEWGFGLPGVYAAWVAVLVILYPACRWFADLKQRRREPWLSYL